MDYHSIIYFTSDAKQANRCDIELTNYIHFRIKAYSSHASRLFGGWYVLHQTNKLENVPNGETCHFLVLEHVVNSRAKVYSNLQDVTNCVVFLQWVFLQYMCHICAIGIQSNLGQSKCNPSAKYFATQRIWTLDIYDKCNITDHLTIEPWLQ